MTASTLQWIITALFIPALGVGWYLATHMATKEDLNKLETKIDAKLDKLDAKLDRVTESLVHIAESAAVAKDRTERAARAV